jgi:hypothetical protein
VKELEVEEFPVVNGLNGLEFNDWLEKGFD